MTSTESLVRRTPGTDTEGLLRALDARLWEAARTLLPDAGAVNPDAPGDYAVDALARLLATLPTRPGAAHWLVLTAVCAAFPAVGDVEWLARRVELNRIPDVVVELLERARDGAGTSSLGLSMEVVSDRPVVYVDYCATTDNHTGIQRVVRETLPRWRDEHALTTVALVEAGTAYRTLAPSEEARVFAYGSHGRTARPTDDDYEMTLVVPWKTVVVLPEVPALDSVPAHVGLARYSGNEVSIIGYDMIPILSAEQRPGQDAGLFSQFLAVVKHAHRVAGISNSASSEFAGFANMLAAQGISGPVVHEVEIAGDVGLVTTPMPEPPRGRPVILAVGRREPHKNIAVVLQAAEFLWAEGADFELVMLGAHGWDMSAIDRTIARLLAKNRPVRTLGWVTDEQMWAQFREATFTVFVSLHEGYGLPIAESLANGTPVLTTDYGSQRELGERGGCLLVDPRDPAAVADGMRRLLNDPELLVKLRLEIAQRPLRRWDDYARDAWAFLVKGQHA